MHLAVVLLGSNLGNRMDSIRNALRKLESKLGTAHRISSVYETASWGVNGPPDYLNCVAGYYTHLPAAEVLDILLSTEISAGRIRSGKLYESRIIDLDLLLLGDSVMHQPVLQIPHPRMTLRRFTMVPLAEIYPELIHPESGQSMAELLECCPDKSFIHKYPLQK